jgi:hypothetical protein
MHYVQLYRTVLHVNRYLATIVGLMTSNQQRTGIQRKNCTFRTAVASMRYSASLIQGDQKVSVHLIITIHVFLASHLAQSDCLVADRQGQGDTRLTLTPSVIANSNYVIMESD